MTAAETPLARLERLRAQGAALDGQQAPRALPVAPGDQFHAKRTGVTFATGGAYLAGGHVSRAGETYTVTQALIDASCSASGRSWLSIVADDDAQIAKWGEVRFGLGPAPVDAETWNRRGDADWAEQREAARREAWAQPRQQARNEALAAVERRFGPPVPTSVTLNTTPDPSIKLAEEQRARLDAGGIRLVSHYSAVEPGAPVDEHGNRR